MGVKLKENKTSLLVSFWLKEIRNKEVEYLERLNMN